MYMAVSHHRTKIMWHSSLAWTAAITIGPDGALTVRNLELGAAARKEDML